VNPREIAGMVHMLVAMRNQCDAMLLQLTKDRDPSAAEEPKRPLWFGAEEEANPAQEGHT
jgi:hypothetical protein